MLVNSSKLAIRLSQSLLRAPDELARKWRRWVRWQERAIEVR